MGAGGAVVGILIAVWIVVYILLQKKCFPPAVTQVLTKIYFRPMLPLTVARNYYHGGAVKIDEGVYMGGTPIVCLGHIDKLHEQGVRAVINLQDEYMGPISTYRQKGWAQLHVPVIDHCEPSVDDLKKCVEFIKKQRGQEAGVYIHCKGGHGRSAAVAFAWLLSENQGMEPIEVQKKLNTMRKVRKGLYKQRNLMEYHMDLGVGNNKNSELDYKEDGPGSVSSSDSQ
eukprot:g25946.t1